MTALKVFGSFLKVRIRWLSYGVAYALGMWTMVGLAWAMDRAPEAAQALLQRASAMSGYAQDNADWLGPKGASATPKGGRPDVVLISLGWGPR